MQFLRVKVTFYDAVNMIHDVITTPNLFPYTVKFMFVGVRNHKTQQIRPSKINIIRTTCFRISKKNLTRCEEMKMFSPRLENYQFSQRR